MNSSRNISVLIICLLLFGCASRPPKVQVPAGWSLQKQQLEKLSEWQLKGKLAYKDGEDAFSASILWSQSKQDSQLRLFNPLGVTLVDIKVQPNFARLKADGKEYQDTDIDSLLYHTTGWNIPVNFLRRWIIGLPDDNDQIVFNEDGTIKRLMPSCEGCNKWQIQYLDYTQHQGLVLPRSLTVTDTSKNNAFIKIRVSSWR